MKQFEYKTIVSDAKGIMGDKVDVEDMERSLNDLGSQSWELIGMTDSNEGSGSTRYVISVFKREKRM